MRFIRWRSSGVLGLKEGARPLYSSSRYSSITKDSKTVSPSLRIIAGTFLCGFTLMNSSDWRSGYFTIRVSIRSPAPDLRASHNRMRHALFECTMSKKIGFVCWIISAAGFTSTTGHFQLKADAASLASSSIMGLNCPCFSISTQYPQISLCALAKAGVSEQSTNHFASRGKGDALGSTGFAQPKTRGNKNSMNTTVGYQVKSASESAGPARYGPVM
mmetsp:Transcript_33263/g.75289  ORF Transcript_33263/g.75289 Transcript_33263/m.75289 type:complete len:217 (+) Transcript_33263:100-750(+)